MTHRQAFSLHEGAPELVALEHGGGEKMGVDVDQHGSFSCMAGYGFVGPCMDAGRYANVMRAAARWSKCPRSASMRGALCFIGSIYSVGSICCARHAAHENRRPLMNLPPTTCPRP